MGALFMGVCQCNKRVTALSCNRNAAEELPFDWLSIKRSLFYYFLASILFSLSHVSIMVAIKEAGYFVMGGNYQFGDFWFELFYEYRKDLWSFIFFILFIHAYNFILSRLQGEATRLAKVKKRALNQV